jgi:hypothetical protein
MQTNLHKFYKSTSVQTNNNKKCFIYDPQNCQALFDNNHNDNDIFVTTKLGIKLYYRRPDFNKSILLPKIQHNVNVSLIKSNLQKAIRRGNTDVAISSALAIIQLEHIQLLRRLPIIYIEDVCLMDSYSIVVWLMMAEKEHKIDINDIDILLNIVKNLCECNKFYDNKFYYTTSMELSHNSLKCNNQILSIYCRMQYGGMKGDMEMLKNSIYYYYDNQTEIIPATYCEIEYDKINSLLVILPEAIDFHPFPKMLTMLEKQTNIDKQIIKECIWFVESGLNIRKQNTIDNSELYKNEYWNIIKSKINNVRQLMLIN